jgi:hypothetical protein
MLGKKTREALLEATRVSVRKEMAKPRMTRSARIAVRNLRVVKAAKHPRATVTHTMAKIGESDHTS